MSGVFALMRGGRSTAVRGAPLIRLRHLLPEGEKALTTDYRCHGLLLGQKVAAPVMMTATPTLDPSPQGGGRRLRGPVASRLLVCEHRSPLGWGSFGWRRRGLLTAVRGAPLIRLRHLLPQGEKALTAGYRCHGLLPLREKVPEQPAPDLIRGRMRGATRSCSPLTALAVAVAAPSTAFGGSPPP